jgi:GNAT superfamily N-acetyltransferase
MLKYVNSHNITHNEITSSLNPLNGGFFHIPDLDAYAEKIIGLGKCVAFRDLESDELASYILYYDNGPDYYISMVWTSLDHRRKGLAAKLIGQLQKLTTKDIVLEVNPDNPAIELYKNIKFRFDSHKADNHIMRLTQRLSVMQPYIFPYIGYFHLIEASSEIVFYDDVNYIKQGWINRNRILLDGKDLMFTVPLKNASAYKTIADTQTAFNDKFKDKFAKQLAAAYSKAPYFPQVSELVLSVFDQGNRSIADIAIDSILRVYDYLGLPINYCRSSVKWPESKGIEKADRLIFLTKASGYDKYINLMGGTQLYDKDYFANSGVELSFVKSCDVSYRQFRNEFVHSLSIIDVLMFNDIETVRQFFGNYNIS